MLGSSVHVRRRRFFVLLVVLLHRTILVGARRILHRLSHFAHRNGLTHGTGRGRGQAEWLHGAHLDETLGEQPRAPLSAIAAAAVAVTVVATAAVVVVVIIIIIIAVVVAVVIAVVVVVVVIVVTFIISENNSRKQDHRAVKSAQPSSPVLSLAVNSIFFACRRKDCR